MPKNSQSRLYHCPSSCGLQSVSGGVVNIVVDAVRVSFCNRHLSKACDFPFKCVQSGGGFVE